MSQATDHSHDAATARSKLAVVRCGDYEACAVDAAVRAAVDLLGGIGLFVKPGQTVLVKPNLLSPRPPEQAVTTHPHVVGAVIRLCQDAGASRIWVGDSCAGGHGVERLWAETGLQAVVPPTGAELRSFTESVESVPCGERRVPVPAWLHEVDVVISLPKLKTHLLTLLTCGVKNMYGIIAGQAKSLYHADHPSPRSMSTFLTDVYAAFTPGLTIVDAVQAMQGDGPANGDPVSVGLILASPDAVAVDSLCARLLGLRPTDISTTRLAYERGLGQADMEHIDVLGDAADLLQDVRLKLPRTRFLQRLPEGLFRMLTWVLKYRPVVDDDQCVRCGVCSGICSQQAIRADEDGRLRIQRERCILCMCCVESCPRHAITVRSIPYAVQRVGRRMKRLWRGRRNPELDV